MIEGMEINIKTPLIRMMGDIFDLVLFSRTQERTKIHHITIEYGEVVTNTFSTIDEFREDQWIEGDLEKSIDFAEEDDPIFKVIKAKYPDVQRVAFMDH